jgi:hypothetical protein
MYPAVIALILFSCVQCSDAAPPSAAALLPPPPAGWQVTQDTKFSGLALSDYIDGGAEIYHAYQFQELAVREFHDPKGTKLTTEIYRMDRPENAFGIFSTDSSGSSWNIGADSSYGDGLLRFWKGPYFVRILAFPAGTETDAATRFLGAAIAEAIYVESRRPHILQILPEKGFIPDSVCYFHRQTSLNNIFFLSDENLLHLDDDVDALTWKQEDPGRAQTRMRLIVVRYPSESAARGAMKDFRGKYLRQQIAPGESSDKPIAKLANQSYAGAVSQNTFVLIVLGADSPDSAARALEQVQKRISSFNPAQGGATL